MTMTDTEQTEFSEEFMKSIFKTFSYVEILVIIHAVRHDADEIREMVNSIDNWIETIEFVGGVLEASDSAYTYNDEYVQYIIEGKQSLEDIATILENIDEDGEVSPEDVVEHNL